MYASRKLTERSNEAKAGALDLPARLPQIDHESAMMMDIGQLAAASGVTRRTIRYYVQIGLLPPPEGRGPSTQYNESHKLRLDLIRRLKDEFLPLDEIRRRMRGLEDRDIEALLSVSPPEEGPVSAAASSPAGDEDLFFSMIQPKRITEGDGRRTFRERLNDRRRSETPPGRPWIRINLLEGLELHLREDKTSEYQDLIESITDWVDHRSPRRRR